jgi:hypothetical protein
VEAGRHDELAKFLKFAVRRGGVMPNKSLEPTATAHASLTIIMNLSIIIPPEARLPWLWLSSGR